MVLPAPVSPTSATVCPAGRSRSSPGSTIAFRYPNRTPANGTRRPLAAVGSATGAGGSATDGSSSSTPEIFSSADAAPWNEL